MQSRVKDPVQILRISQDLLKAGLYDLVIIARKVPPVPIPNTTVKLLSADGTMSQGMGEYVVAKSYKPAFFCICHPVRSFSSCTGSF